MSQGSPPIRKGQLSSPSPRQLQPRCVSSVHTSCLTVTTFYICRYDDILVNGLPDWRQPVFYYRRVRKMSNAELGFLLFLILTVGHYAVIWSIYLEKQLVRQLMGAGPPSEEEVSWAAPQLSVLPG